MVFWQMQFEIRYVSSAMGRITFDFMCLKLTLILLLLSEHKILLAHSLTYIVILNTSLKYHASLILKLQFVLNYYCINIIWNTRLNIFNPYFSHTNLYKTIMPILKLKDSGNTMVLTVKKIITSWPYAFEGEQNKTVI